MTMIEKEEQGALLNREAVIVNYGELFINPFLDDDTNVGICFEEQIEDTKDQDPRFFLTEYGAVAVISYKGDSIWDVQLNPLSIDKYQELITEIECASFENKDHPMAYATKGALFDFGQYILKILPYKNEKAYKLLRFQLNEKLKSHHSLQQAFILK